MNKLQLTANVLNADLKEPEITDDQRKAKIADAIKTYAADMLNLRQLLADKKIEGEDARDLMEQQGLEYSGKTKKFS